MYGFGDDEFVKRQKELQQMKFGLDDLQKSFNEMPGIKFGTYDVTGRENPNPETTLGKVDFSKLIKSDTVGSIYESFQPKDINLKSELPSENASGGLDFLGSKGTDVASTSVAAGMKALTMSQTTANNDGESVMNGIDMTMKGTQAGMAIGGPWGAAIGGALGLGYGIYDGFADANKRGRNKEELIKKGLTKTDCVENKSFEFQRVKNL